MVLHRIMLKSRYTQQQQNIRLTFPKGAVNEEISTKIYNCVYTDVTQHNKKETATMNINRIIIIIEY